MQLDIRCPTEKKSLKGVKSVESLKGRRPVRVSRRAGIGRNWVGRTKLCTNKLRGRFMAKLISSIRRANRWLTFFLGGDMGSARFSKAQDPFIWKIILLERKLDFHERGVVSLGR